VIDIRTGEPKGINVGLKVPVKLVKGDHRKPWGYTDAV
jgi:hypothetical protein